MIELRKTDRKTSNLLFEIWQSRTTGNSMKTSLLGLARHIGKPRRLLKPEKNQLRMGE